MFRSSSIIRELALNLSKVIFMLEHSVKLRRYLLCSCAAACHGMACVLYFLIHNFSILPLLKSCIGKTTCLSDKDFIAT
jgi:hypothetical protein